MQRAVIILAAGQSRRMKSGKSKFLQEIAGKPLINYITDACKEFGFSKKIIVSNPKQPLIVEGWDAVLQPSPKGTADAVMCAKLALKGFEGEVLILHAGSPFITTETIYRMFDLKEDKGQGSIICLSCEVNTPNTYGRVVLKEEEPQQISAIIEYKNASDEHKSITLCNAGPMLCDKKVLFDMLSEVDDNNNAKEFMLPDIVNIAVRKGLVAFHIEIDEEEMVGINSREELAQAERMFQRNKRREIMAKGVTLLSPETVYFSWDTEVGQDCIIEPFVYFATGAVVEPGTRVKAFSRVSNRKYTRVYAKKNSHERMFSEKFIVIFIFMLLIAMFPLWIWLSSDDERREMCSYSFEMCVMDSQLENKGSRLSCIVANLSCLASKSVVSAYDADVPDAAEGEDSLLLEDSEK